MYVVSNTEVTTWSLCRRQHHYRFAWNDGDGIEPKWFNLPWYLYRGIIGHEALAAYYIAMQEGLSIAECRKAAFAVLEKEKVKVLLERPDDLEHIKLLNELRILIDTYSHRYEIEPFKVLEVETVHQTKISSDTIYSLRLDLLIEYTRGKFRGHVMVMDHKFVYNFFTLKKILMNSQFPKYIKTVADDLGIVVTRGVINQIRHRSIKEPDLDQLFKRELVTITPQKINNIWNEQIRISDKIVHSDGEEPLRTLSDPACRSCLFQTVCDTELEGQPVDNLVKTQFQKNRYGYTEFEDE